MEETAALALAQCAQDEVLQVRDAPAKGAGAVGCFARLALPPRTFLGSYAGRLVDLPEKVHGERLSEYAFDLGHGTALDPAVEQQDGSRPTMLYVCPLHYLNEPTLGEQCNARFFIDQQSKRVFARTLVAVDAGDELLVSFGCARRKRSYQTNEDECKRHCPAELCRRDEIRYKRRVEGQQPWGAGGEHVGLIAASSTTRIRRPSRAIDFSQLQKREQVKALSRLSELCHPGELDTRSARANAGEDADMNSLGDVGSNTDDSCPPHQLRRRERSNSSRSNSEPGVIDIEARVVGRSDDAQPDATQPEFARPQTAPPSPPPTHAGTVDMLSCKRDGERVLRDDALRLVPPRILRKWTVDSQRAYWEQRWRFWEQKPVAELRESCKQVGLWPSGSADDLCTRLVLYEYSPSNLEPAQWLGGSPPLTT